MTFDARRIAWPVLAVGATLLVYAPITRNFFYADDFVVLYELANYPLAETVLEPVGGHLFTVRNLVFAAMYRVFGADPRGYFWVVLLTHGVNVLLLYHVVRRWTGSAALAGLGATLWGTMPLAEGTLGWYSAYGTVMVATILLVVLDQAGRLEASDGHLSPARAGLWVALWLVAATCFGVALGLAIAFPAAASLLFPGRISPPARALLWALLPAAVAMYVGHQALYARLIGTGLPGTQDLLHTTSLSTAPAALLGHLLAVGVSGLVLGAAQSSTSYPDTASAVVIGLVGAGVIGTAMTASATLRRRLFASVLLALAAYAVVAAGRAGFWSLFKVPMAKAALVPRYHYVGTLLLAVILSLVLAQLGTWRILRRLPGRTLAGLALAVTLLTWGRWGTAIDHHDTERAETTQMLDTIHAAVAGSAPGSAVYIPNHGFLAAGWMVGQTFPGWGAIYTVFFPTDEVDGRRVRFVAENAARLAQLRPGTRAAAMYVAPGTVPPPTADPASAPPS